jgi:PKD repeat protein
MSRTTSARRGRIVAACAFLAALAPATPAVAAEGLLDLDRRFDRVEVAPTEAQLSALAQLGDVEVGWSELGTPHSLRARDGALTAPSAAAPDSIARAFLADQAALFRQDGGEPDGLELWQRHRDAITGRTSLRYRQLDRGREVHGSSLLVVLDRDGRIELVGGSVAPSLDGAPAPELTAAEAVARAALDVSPQTLPEIDRLSAAGGTVTFENTLALPDLAQPQPVEAELVLLPTAAGARAAWRVQAEVASNADYEVLVDAATGEILFRENHVSGSGPEGLVFTNDDPETSVNQVTVDFTGWVAAGGATTQGNNVDAYQDLAEDDTKAAADQPNAADQHFNYTWTNPWGTGMPPTVPAAGADRDAVVTQLFYYTNWFHDVIYALGFTETAGNFQEDNFGNGGTGGDSVLAESDDGYGTGTEMLCLDGMTAILCRNNANFNTNGADGNNPRMQMYVGEVDMGGGVTRRTQRAMNRDTVIHEYMHGVVGRAISNGNLQGGVQSGGLGEGWGDAMATSLNNDPVYGEYNNGNYTTGIRGFAYDSDSLEYGDLCSWGGGCQVHNDGRIWAMAMWEQRTALIAKLGPSGQGYHERLIMQGILGTPDTPSFHDARTAYLAADVAEPGPDNQCLLWRVFADNELGVTAAPDADDDTTPTVSTATPAACDPGAAIAPPAVTPEGSPVSLDGTASTVGGDAGDTLAYAWDLDDDGQFDDSTSATPSWTFGDNGSFTVKLRVTNTAGYSDDASATVTVTNVAPTVTIDAGQLTTRLEGQALPVLAHFTDPGWLDTYPASTVDHGTAYLADVPGTVAITAEGPPANVGTVQATLTYGDNGSFTVTVDLTDDDGGTGDDSFVVTVSNVAPTAAIDLSGATLINGIPTFMGTAGAPMGFTGSSTDPGSDDLTLRWAWDDGTADTVTPSLVNPPGSDPAASPTNQPRAEVNGVMHTFGDACMYTIRFRSTDDDLGTSFQDAAVLIVGNETKRRSSGYWQHQYRGNGRIDYTAAELDCFLEVAAWVSTVFNEARNASTRALAHDVLFMAANGGSAAQKFDRALLTALVNFANGSLGYGPLSAVLPAAEAVRLNPASTQAQLNAQTKILHDLSH